MASLRKGLCWLLGAAMASSVVTAGTVSTAAYDDTTAGGYCNNGTYTPTAGVQTKHLMFAMPGAWMNDTWENTPGGGAAGVYWWTGYDAPDNKFVPGWPGYQAVKVSDGSVTNLYAMDVPVYGNGEKGNGMQIIWNNYLDSGIDKNPVSNPFYDAAQQTQDTPAQYYARGDVHPEYYDKVLRYAYLENFKKIGVPGSETIQLDDDSFWYNLNKLAAAYLGEDWDRLNKEDKTYQVDNVLDEENESLDFSMFGSYADNFFNEDMVGDDCYPNEEANGFGMAFTFDNMVYVVDLAPEHMTVSPISGKAGFGGDFYFYYGGGAYGSWPTKELNTQMGGVSGNFTEDSYVNSSMQDITIPNTTPSNPYVPDATSSTVPYTPNPGAGGYCNNGTYTPTAGVQTKHLMFAMPGAWMNDTWENTPGGGAAGVYWWTGYDTPDNKFGHGWPGYQAVKVSDGSVTNLYAMDVPVYGNGEKGNGMQIIWNNYLDSGIDKNPVSNPFYDAAQQVQDTPAQYYSRYDKHTVYDKLFRYAYLENFKKIGVPGSESMDLDDDSFWEKLNKLAAAYMGESWDRLTNEEKTYQVDNVLDEENESLDFSMFGSYAGNFFNEDMVGDDCYPNEETNGFGMAFTFDNMVYVVDLAPEHMTVSPLSGKAGFGGDWFFYYGGGEYGSWPTKELNTQMGGVSGNFTEDSYVNSSMQDITIPNTTPSNPYVPDATSSTVPYSPNPGQAYSGKIYFDADSTNWNNYKNITCYLYDKNQGELITWGSKKGYMTDEGNGIWSFDLEAKGYELYSGKNYGVIFTADWMNQTCDLILGPDSMGDTAYCTDDMVENSVDSNKKSAVVKWRSGQYGNPVCITAIGNVIGDCFWAGETPYSVFLDFLTSTDSRSIYNAVKYNGKTIEQTAWDTGYALGLSQNDIIAACRAANIPLDHAEPSGTEPGDSFAYTLLDDGTYMITDYYGSEEYVEIPASVKGAPIYTYHTEIDGDMNNPTAPVAQSVSVSVTYEEYPVTAIGDWVFYNNKYIESVYIPDSITSIGTGAFYGCPRLTEVTVPDSVTELGANAFEKCLYLESVTLSENLTEIKDETFLDCRRLQYINIPDGVTAIGAEVFYNCRALSTMVLPETVESVGKAGDPVGVFENCRCLQTIVLPKNVKSIEENAFEGCRLVNISTTDGSYAAKYAAQNGIATQRMGGVTTACRLIGDVNSNTVVSIEDATHMQKHLAEFAANHLDSNDPEVLAMADTDGDGNITVNDVTTIQRFLAELIHSFR